MRLKIADLCTGDRFVDHGRLFTRMGDVGDGKHAHARLHGESSLRLGDQGYGYHGDSLVTFPLSYRVTFQPPTHPQDQAPTAPIAGEQRLRNQVDALVAVILDGYEPHQVLRAYADELGAKDRRAVFTKAAVKGIDLRKPRERRLVGIGIPGRKKTLP